jgi:hypothetical protein
VRGTWQISELPGHRVVSDQQYVDAMQLRIDLGNQDSLTTDLDKATASSRVRDSSPVSPEPRIPEDVMATSGCD